jgi:hypothetical protein
VETRAVTATQPGPPETEANGVKNRTWSELLALIELDQRTKSAPLPGPLVRPFGGPRVPAESSNTTEPAVTDPADVEPKELGLVLMSTVVGPRSRLASIDGKVYRSGEMIRVVYTEDRASTTILEYRLEEIQPTYVTLSRKAKVYRLPLHRRELADDLRKPRVVGGRTEG